MPLYNWALWERQRELQPLQCFRRCLCCSVAGQGSPSWASTARSPYTTPDALLQLARVRVRAILRGKAWVRCKEIEGARGLQEVSKGGGLCLLLGKCSLVCPDPSMYFELCSPANSSLSIFTGVYFLPSISQLSPPWISGENKNLLNYSMTQPGPALAVVSDYFPEEKCLTVNDILVILKIRDLRVWPNLALGSLYPDQSFHSSELTEVWLSVLLYGQWMI